MRSAGECNGSSSGAPARSLVTLTPLSLLFAALVEGCSPKTDTSTDSTSYAPCTAYYVHDFTLSAEEYAQWSRGIPPGDSLGPVTESSTPTTGDVGGTAGDTGSTGSSTGGDTGSSTGETGGTTAGTTGPAVMLTDDEMCHMVCAQDEAADELIGCSIGPPDMAGSVIVECKFPAGCGGRRHACVRPHAAAKGHDAAGWLTRAAHDEAASVHAFVALAGELALQGAPATLLSALAAAAADEARHADAVADLARAHGGVVPAPVLVSSQARDLLAIAVENAVEGCVHETWAGLCATHQARHARDPRVRAAYAVIAGDEARHADLAWALAAWLEDQLDPAARALVAAARRAAVADLHAEIAARVEHHAEAELGLPDLATARFLLAGLDAALWSQAA